MGSAEIKGLVRDRDRHGNVRVYIRQAGRKVRIRAPEGTPEFLEECRAAQIALHTGKAPAPGRRAAKPGTMRALIFSYLQSGDFKALAGSTRRVRRNILDRLDAAIGDHSARLVETRHIRKWRDAPDGPEAGNAIVKVLRQVFELAVEDGLIEVNPARSVKYRKSGNPDGFTPWDAQDVRRFIRRHPPGSMAYKALWMALLLGQRRSDIYRLGPQHERDGWLVFTQAKNKDRKPVRVEVPISAALRRILDDPQSGHLAYIVSDFGRPYQSAASFGNRFAKWVAEAKIEGRSLHGLRKSASAILAELGLTSHQIQAVSGHTTLKEVERYTRAVSRRRLAETGYGSLDDRLAEIVDQMGNENVPPDGKSVPPPRKALK